MARAGEHIVFLREEHLPLVLQRLSKEHRFRAKVKGILVESGTPDVMYQSPADKSPLAEYALYKDSSYPWNPNGTGISRLDIGVPIFYMEGSLAASAHSSAFQNSQQVS